MPKSKKGPKELSSLDPKFEASLSMPGTDPRMEAWRKGTSLARGAVRPAKPGEGHVNDPVLKDTGTSVFRMKRPDSKSQSGEHGEQVMLQKQADGSMKEISRKKQLIPQDGVKKDGKKTFYAMEDNPILPDPFTTVECLFGDYFRKMIENRLNVMRATDKSIKVGKEVSKMYPAFNHGQSRSSLDGCAKQVKDKMPELDRPWKIIVTKVNMSGPCVQCRVKAGRLNCVRCMAVKFCSAECQRKLWPAHKAECNEVHRQAQLVGKAMRAMARFLGIPVDKDQELDASQLESLSTLLWNTRGKGSKYLGDIYWKYCWPRIELIDLYSEIGMKRRSAMAFRLSCENQVDFMKLFHFCDDEDVADKYAGCPDKHSTYFASWMIAGDMDQAALDFLVNLRLTMGTAEEKEGGEYTKSSLEFFSKLSVSGQCPWFVDRFIVFPFFKFDPDRVHYDIEGTDYLDLFEMPVSFKDWEFVIGVKHGKDMGKDCGVPGLPLPPGGQRGFWYMMLAIIKYKRLQELLWQRKVFETRVDTLRQGVLDDECPLAIFRGHAPVVAKVTDYLAPPNLDQRIVSLKAQVEHLLNLAYDVHYRYFQRDEWYICWTICHSYSSILSGFLQRKGSVLGKDLEPVVDWKHVAFDTDPSVDLGAHLELDDNNNILPKLE